MFVLLQTLLFFFYLLGAPNIIQYVNHRLGGGFHDVGRQTYAMVAAAVVRHHDINLAQRIAPLTLGG